MPSSRGRIDVHYHIIPSFFTDQARAGGRKVAFPDWSKDAALEMMDRYGIEVGITSYPKYTGRVKLLELTRQSNDYAAELCARWPKRFGAFGTVPLPDVKASVAEVERALGELKFDGVCLFSNYDGKYLGDPAFDPVMELLNDRQAVLFVHPCRNDWIEKAGLPWPPMMIEFPFDTTCAAVNMLFNGTLERFPRIQIILSHAGGLLPFLAWRLSVAPRMDARIPQLSSEQVHAGLRRYWYDNALSHGPASMGALVPIADPSRVLYGSDWPFTDDEVLDKAEKSDAEDHLSSAQHAAIDRGNAAGLFPRFA